MKISAFLLFSSLWLIHVRTSNADYRYRRMPPPPPRAPVPPYLKKWHGHHARQPINRPRPIPLHMSTQLQQQQLQQLQQQQQREQQQQQPPPPPQYKKPIGPPVPKRSIPVSASRQKLLNSVPQLPPNWNSKPTYEYVRHAAPQEKQFLSSPKLPISEFDYHLQTNQIPNHSNLIKQVGEKGPIHTIPAPNLSLADKPTHVDIVEPKQQKTLVEIQKAHQYQVTESNENLKNAYSLNSEIYKAQESGPQLLQTEALLSTGDQLNQQDLLKIFQNYQQPLLETYNIPLLQDQQQNAYHQQTQQQYFQPDQAYLSQLQQTVHQTEIKPEYQTFNYEEPVNRAHSQVFAEYSIQPEKTIDGRNNNNNNNAEAVSQSQFVQNYFDAQTPDNVETTDSNHQTFKFPEIEEIVNYHTPQVGTVLSVQEAGSNRGHQEADNDSRQGSPMTIYVPDDADKKEKNGDDYQQQKKQQDEDAEGSSSSFYEYDEQYSQEDAGNVDEANDGQNQSFGSRLKPKKF